MSFKSYRASGTVFLLVQIFAVRGMPTFFADVIPTCRETEEANSRDGRLLSWVSTLPGATRNCSLLVRGTLTFRSFRRLPSQVETGRTCDVYNGQLVHPCRVQSFRKAVSAVMDDLRPTTCS